MKNKKPELGTVQWENSCDKCCIECKKDWKKCDEHCVRIFNNDGECDGCKYIDFKYHKAPKFSIKNISDKTKLVLIALIITITVAAYLYILKLKLSNPDMTSTRFFLTFWKEQLTGLVISVLAYTGIAILSE